MPQNAEFKGGRLRPDPGPLPARSALDELVQPLSRGAPAAKMGETAAKGLARGRCSGPAAAACPRAQASWPSRPRRVERAGFGRAASGALPQQGRRARRLSVRAPCVCTLHTVVFLLSPIAESWIMPRFHAVDFVFRNLAPGWGASVGFGYPP